jgi:hypothetical protein
VFGPLETTGTNAATNYRESFNRFSESLNSSTVVPKQVQVEQINSPQEFQRIASSGLSAAPSAIQLAQSKGYQLEYKNGLKAFVAPRVRQFENTWAKGKTMENRVLLLGVYDEYSDALYVERYIAPRGTLQFRSEWVGQTKEDYDAYIKLHSEIVDLIDNYVYTRSQESLNQIAQYLDFLNKHGLLVTDEPTAYLARAYTSGDPNWYTYLDQVDVIGTSHIVNNTKAFQQYAASQIIQSEIVPSKKLYEVGTNHIHPSGATDPSFGDACAQAYLTQEGGIIKTIREKLGIIPKRPFTYSSISVDPTQTRGQGYVPLIVGENTCVNVLGVWRSGAIRPEDFHPNETIPILATTYTQ